MGHLDVYDKIELILSPHRQGEMDHFYPKGICVVPERSEILVCHSFYGIQIYSKRLELVGLFYKTPLLNNELFPIGICVFEGKILVADSNNKRIQIFGSTYNYVSFIDTSDYTPRWVCCQKGGNIIVSTYQNTVLIFDRNGTICKTFGSMGDGKGEFYKIFGLCCNSRDEIIAIDNGNHRVQVFDKNGNFLHMFGSRGNSSNQFNSPTSVCTDWQDNLLVTDQGNNRISIFTPNGYPIQQISCDNPTGICLWQERIFVLKRYSLINVFSVTILFFS